METLCYEPKKTYIEVLVRHKETGLLRPEVIIWGEDRHKIKIDRLLFVKPDFTRKDRLKSDEPVLRYEVQIGGQQKVLYHESESNRWFVLEKRSAEHG